MAKIIGTEISVYDEVINSLRKIRISLGMHTDAFTAAVNELKKGKKWPAGLFKTLKDNINREVNIMIARAAQLRRSGEKLDMIAAGHLEYLAEKISSWYNEIMTTQVITKSKAAWSAFAGPTLENFLEKTREDLVRLAIDDKINKSQYTALNREINNKFNALRQEAFKEIHAGV